MVALILLMATPGSAQVLGGRVLEDGTERPLATATVRILDLSGNVVAADESGPDGGFELEVGRSGQHLLIVDLLGYAQVQVVLDLPAEERVHAEILMTPEAVPVEPVVVEAEPRNPGLQATGYYERRDRGMGLGIDRAEIEERHPRRVSDLLQGKARTRVVRSSRLPWQDVRFVGSEKVNMLGITYCWPAILVDGIVARRAIEGTSPGTWLDEIAPPPSQIEAVELFRSGAEVPSRFGATGSSCGIVAIWTRR